MIFFCFSNVRFTRVILDYSQRRSVLAIGMKNMIAGAGQRNDL